MPPAILFPQTKRERIASVGTADYHPAPDPQVPPHHRGMTP